LTGSGVLSIAAALLGAKHIRAFDLDEVAVTTARINIKLNKVNKTVDVSQNNLLDGVIENSADVVVANILAEVILRFTDDTARVVKPGGYFIASGIIQQKKEQVMEALENADFEIVETILMEDWVAIISKKK
jgi:ribosomal protein L11 methyltransferase